MSSSAFFEDRSPIRPVDAVLSDNGITKPQTHLDRRRLALDLLRAEVGAYETVLERRSGDPTPTPERLAVDLETRHEVIRGLDVSGVEFSQVKEAAIRLGLSSA